MHAHTYIQKVKEKVRVKNFSEKSEQRQVRVRKKIKTMTEKDEW